ncbi:MAG: carboxypeptidase regulatory-like domain-containing protein [Thermoleophilia bacterium]
MRARRGAAVVLLSLLLALLAVSTAQAFSDVSVSHPNSTAIDTLAFEGVIGGYPDGTFRPDGPILRAQFAKMASLLFSLPCTEEDVPPFADVERPADSLYPDNYVAVAARAGLTRGTTETTFEPYKSITRAQVMTMLVRAVDVFYPGLLREVPSDWVGVVLARDPTHGENIRRAEFAGLLAGLPLSRFAPGDPASRAEVAQMLWNLQAILVPPVVSTVVQVQVGFPASFPVGPLLAVSATAEGRVDAAGKAALSLPAGAGLIVVASGDTPVLLGFRDPTSSVVTLDARSTADALVLMHPLVVGSMPELRAEALSALHGRPTYGAYVAEVERALRNDPLGLTSGNNPVLSDLATTLGNEVAADLQAITANAEEGARLLQSASIGILLASVTPPEHGYSFLWGWAKADLRVLPWGGDSLTLNLLPVAFEGSFKDELGQTLQVPYLGGLVKLPVQIVPRRGLYSTDSPEVVFDLPDRAGTYGATYSPTGEYALSVDAFNTVLDVLKAVVGVEIDSRIESASGATLLRLIELRTNWRFLQVVDAFESGNPIDMVKDSLELISDPVFQQMLSPAMQASLQIVASNAVGNKVWGWFAQKVVPLYTATKLAHDGAWQLATFGTVAYQEAVNGPQTWKIVVRDLGACVVRGRVDDARSGTPLPGVVVSALDPTGAGNAVTQTDSDGEYRVDLKGGTTYALTFSKAGYRTERYDNVKALGGDEKWLEAVLQVDDRPGLGGLGGKIIHALSGDGVKGVELTLRKGINVETGAVLGTGETSWGGTYSFSGLEPGNYTLEASKPGFVTLFFTVTVLAEENRGGQNGAITPILDPGQTRIVLTWGEVPQDLDSHLTGPKSVGLGRFHIYYAAKGSRIAPTYAFLDLDDISSFGPETVTIIRPSEGVYRYSVHDFTNRAGRSGAALANSRARVRIFVGSSLLGDFSVPNAPGTLWTVFEMEGGALTAINTMGWESRPNEIR